MGAALGTLAIALLFLIAYVLWGRPVALWSAGFGAVFPPLVLLSTGLIAENLFLPVMLGAIACTVAARQVAAQAALGASRPARCAGWRP